MGTFMTAWFIGKLRGQDLRELHSGNLGARNAGRTFGKGAFVITAAGDVLKGVAVVLFGRYLGISETLVAAAILAVVCGHLYPFWLRWRGGKGVATVLGAMLMFSWQASIICALSFLFAFLIKRSATLSLVAGFIAYSIAIISWQVEGFTYITFAILLVIWKHRENISKRVK
ncbi:MAG: glycerol-3-phosphate acyltransferase [Solibacillus sp.]